MVDFLRSNVKICPNNFLTNVEPIFKDGDLNTINQKNIYIGLATIFIQG